MNRRKLLRGASLAAASVAISAPAIAQSAPALKWRLTTSFPKTLDTLYGACELFAKTVGELSDQKFQISVFGPGEIVPAFQVLDAVANNTVEMGNSADYYYIGKDPAFAFGTAVPFGLNTRMRGLPMAAASIFSMSFTAATASPRSPSAIRRPRWAAGSARRSRQSTT